MFVGERVLHGTSQEGLGIDLSLEPQASHRSPQQTVNYPRSWNACVVNKLVEPTRYEDDHFLNCHRNVLVFNM